MTTRRMMATALVLLALAPAAGAAPSDVAAAMARIDAAPFHYGGELQGLVPGLARPTNASSVHLSLGLDAPAADGTLAGEAILFTPDRRLVALGPVTGTRQAGATPGNSDCTLRLALPAQDVTLTGLCQPDALSGEIVSQPHRVGLLTRIVSWWGDRETTGRYWLDRASFDQPVGVASR